MFKECLSKMLFGLISLFTAPLSAAPIIGQPAPEIFLKTDFDTSWRLSDHKGKWVVLFFLPSLKGVFGVSECANQMCSISSSHHEFKVRGAIPVGIETGSIGDLGKFRKAKRVSKEIVLLSDPHCQAIKAYGTGGWFFSTNRETFIINPHGKIAHIIRGHSMDGEKHMKIALDWLNKNRQG